MISEVSGPSPWQELLGAASPEVAVIATRAREVVRGAVPDALEEVDVSARMLGFTFAPGTYKGLFAGLVLHATHVNLMFSDGVALAGLDAGGLLEGTGKLARHIKLRTPAGAEVPRLAELVAAAAELRRLEPGPR
ncbi:hypothetical protein ABZZ17_24820 [Streptomyces sp. NPDC006512]|uniref:hypothetical protein n=1 Tax=Streptomyces sp. NPDC006512 TaxID=3154307 RepID=UPI0033B2401E